MNINGDFKPSAFRFRLAPVFLIPMLLLFLNLVGCMGNGPKKVPTDPLPPQIAPSKFPTMFVHGLSPLDPQPQKGAMKPGLSVIYYYKYFHRHLRFLSTNKLGEGSTRKPGKPIPLLNHHYERVDKIFDSGAEQGVAMRIRGLIQFPKAGKYAFQAISNDGILVYLSGKVIISDPTQHSDRLSNLAVVDITVPGWYPLMVEYFQRKGTATIKLYWRKPGEEKLKIVPAAAFAHTPDV